MKIGTSAIVMNHAGELLVIQRDDTRTWAAPGGLLERGEEPLTGIAREVEEETGFKVLPVRLVGLHFMPIQPGYLQLVFRCLLRGGEARVSAESLQVGFTSTHPLAVPMLTMHRERALMGAFHAGGPPFWGTDKLSWGEKIGKEVLFRGLYPWRNVIRRWRGESPYIAPPLWQATAYVVLRRADGRVLWVRQPSEESWRLPGGVCRAMEPPWEAAARAAQTLTGGSVRLTDLSGVYTEPAQQAMSFVFTGEVTGDGRRGGNSAESTHRPPDAPLPNTLPDHLPYVADAVTPHEFTGFHRLPLGASQ